MFFAHMGWLFYVYPKAYDDQRIRQQARDVARDPYLSWLETNAFLPGCMVGALLLAFGEGWHNNHHAWPASARQGLQRWELDVSWMLISTLKRLGLAWDVTLVKPDHTAAKGGELIRT